jgi:hypothetical protein
LPNRSDESAVKLKIDNPMKPTQLVIILVTISSFIARPASAVDPVVMLNNLKVQLHSLVGMQPPGTIGASTFVLASPGIPIDTTADPDADADDKELLNMVLNRIPLGDIYGGIVTGQTDSDTIPKVYDRILKGYQSTLPEPTVEEKAKLLELNATWSALADNYYDYQGRWLLASTKARWAEISKNPAEKQLAPVLVGLAQKANTDMDRVDKGNGGAFRKAYSDWISFNDKLSGGEDWGQRDLDFIDGQNLKFPVKTWPKYKGWKDESGWTKISISSSDLQSTTTHTTLEVSGKAGFWGFGGSAGHTEDVTVSDATKSSMSITMEVKRVLLLRDSWLDAGVFRSKKWVWRDANEEMVSYGKFDITDVNNKQFKGRMPLYPTSIILVRKVALSADWGNDFASHINTHTNASGGWGWGPFSVGGSYGNSKDTKYSRVQASGSSLEIPDVQIIGWICQVLPKCPQSQP